ncbi:hypothetical protein CIP101841_00423 [Corynebacterium diphtheriae]|nr:hypothetical protein CIP101841_00423 [Corynebacterium diphtheriae]
MLIDESESFLNVLGLVRMRKKLRRLSTTHWCPAAGDFLDAAWRPLPQGPRALIPQHVLRDERACVHCLAVCHDLGGCLHGHVLRQDAVFHEADHSVLRFLVKFFLACSKIFPPTQTEQNLGHFNTQVIDPVPRCTPSR